MIIFIFLSFVLLVLVWAGAPNWMTDVYIMAKYPRQTYDDFNARYGYCDVREKEECKFSPLCHIEDRIEYKYCAPRW